MEAVATTISGFALLFSLIVFVENRRRQVELDRLARQPALVLAYDGPQQQWKLTNIGSGPALDVVMLQRSDGHWEHPLRMPELGVDTSESVPRRWVENWHDDPGLAVRYLSIKGEEYMTVTGNDASRISEGWGDLPDRLWRDIEPHWAYRRAN